MASLVGTGQLLVVDSAYVVAEPSVSCVSRLCGSVRCGRVTTIWRLGRRAARSVGTGRLSLDETDAGWIELAQLSRV